MPAPAVIGAIAAARVHGGRYNRELVTAQDRAYLRHKRQREDVDAAYSREMDRQQHEQFDQLRRVQEERQSLALEQLRKDFERYDTNCSGILEREELRQLLHDVEPDMPPPGDDVCNTMMDICAATSPDGIAISEVREVRRQYKQYLSQRAQLDVAFKALDTSGNGFLEQAELAQAMRDLVPQQRPGEADLAFLYRACRVEPGEPLPRSMMGLLLPALDEWAQLARESLVPREQGLNDAAGSMEEDVASGLPLDVTQTDPALRAGAAASTRGAGCCIIS